MIKIENLKNGTAKVTYPAGDKRVKIRVNKTAEYVYDHTGGTTAVPLQMGRGDYEIGVFEQVEGDRYMQTITRTVADNSPETAVFLAPSVIVRYSSSNVWAGELKRLTNGLTPAKIVEKVSEHIKNKLEYDAKKAKNIGDYPGYTPDTDTVYKSGLGICCDYAVLFAAMLRYSGVPCKVVYGYVKGGTAYHAWNEVYLSGKWTRYDLTYEDAGVRNYNDYKAKYYY